MDNLKDVRNMASHFADRAAHWQRLTGTFPSRDLVAVEETDEYAAMWIAYSEQVCMMVHREMYRLFGQRYLAAS